MEKKKSKKKILIVIGVLAVIIILISALGGGGDNKESTGKDKNNKQEVSNADTASSDNKDSDNDLNDPNAEGGDASVTQEAEAPADGRYHVGDTYIGDGLSVTYTEFGEYTGYDDWNTPSDGMKVVYASFYVENTGKSDVTVSYFDFHGYCDNKEISQYYGVDGSGLDFSLDLSAGRNGTGTVAFEVPQDVTDLSKVEMEFTSDYWSDAKVLFVGEGDGTVVKSDSVPDSSSGSSVADEEKYRVGDSYEGDSLKVKFVECGEYTDYSEYLPPADGNKIIYAKFEFENTGSDEEYVMYTDFNAFADNKNVNQYYSAEDTDNTAFSCNLSAGRSGSGTVMFEVPENSEEIDIEFSPSFWSSEHVVFKYSK